VTSLRGLRIALLEARKSEELESLVRRRSGVPYVVPAVREVERDSPDEVRAAVAWLNADARRVVLLLTGVGVEAFFRQAHAVGLEADLQAAFGRVTLVCRGPKPVAALKARGLTATVRAAEPYTTETLVEAATPHLRGVQEALVVHYGELSSPLVVALAERGVRTRDLLLYEWALPDDIRPVERLVEEIVEGRVGAVAFTSQIQARNLFLVAERMKLRGSLLEALASRVLVAAIGPTCADALRALGVTPRVVPTNPKMGPMIESLAQAVEGTGAPDGH
jgi:uroporphyrinogen-III synthase